MKKIFIYYSYTGNGDVVSKELESKGYDIRKVISNYKISKNLFLAMMKGGFDSLRKKKPKLLNYDNNIEEYEEVVIGSPIWNSRFSPVVNTILKETNLDNKKVTFILYSGGGEAKEASKYIKKNYPKAQIINLKEPKKYHDELKKLGGLYEYRRNIKTSSR